MVKVKAIWMSKLISGRIISDSFGILIVDTGEGWYEIKACDIQERQDG